MWAWLRRLWIQLVDLITRQSAHAAESQQHVNSTYEQIIEDTVNLINFLRDLEHFDFNPAWKTRVINVPAAFDGINELFDIMFHGLRDRFQTLHVGVLDLLHSLEGHPPIQGHFGDPGGTVTKVVNYIGDAATAWRAFGQAYHAAVDIVSLVDDLKRRIETLDDLFLQQGNPKKTVEKNYRQRQRS